MCHVPWPPCVLSVKQARQAGAGEILLENGGDSSVIAFILLNPGVGMPRFLLLSAISVLGPLLAACGVLSPDDTVEVRLENISRTRVDEVMLYLPDTTLTFLDLPPDSPTPYLEVRRAYRMATVQAVLGPDTARLQVIDFVGETPLARGKYSYLLDVFPGPPFGIALDIRKDN